MKNKLLAIILCSILCMSVIITGCQNQDKTENNTNEIENRKEPVGMVNPWSSSDAEDIVKSTGISFKEPDGASDIVYRYMKTENTTIAEMDFTMDSTDFCYRISPADELTDISGMFYTWTVEMDDKVAYCDGKSMTYVGGDDADDVQVILWYDVVPGLTYSLSATGSDLNGMDITVYANMVFESAQGDS